MSFEGKFNKAVEIVQGLPKDGPIKPAQEDQLYVRHSLPMNPSVHLNHRCFVSSSTSSTSKVSDIQITSDWYFLPWGRVARIVYPSYGIGFGVSELRRTILFSSHYR